MTDYLDRAGLTALPRQARVQPGRLRLHDLHRQQRAAHPEVIAAAIDEHDLVVARCCPATATSKAASTRSRANYLASPPLVVAYALAGRMRHRPDQRAARRRPGRKARCSCATSGPRQARSATIDADVLVRDVHARYADVSTATSRWRALGVPDGDRLRLGADSTYIRSPPFFDGHAREPRAARRHRRRAGARPARRLGHDRPHLTGRRRSKPTPRPASI